MTLPYQKALIIGAGAGLSASLARKLAAEGVAVALAARSTDDLGDLAVETGATLHTCDAGDRAQIAETFRAVEAEGGAPDILIYNPSARMRGPFIEIDGARVADCVNVTAVGAFHAAQEAAKRMVPNGRGAILFTGASAGVKGFPQSAVFAMGKFALRGLAQSLARELHPKGVHIGHFVIDGGISSEARPPSPDAPNSMLSPDAIAGEYLNLLRQHPSCWSWEVELRPLTERF